MSPACCAAQVFYVSTLSIRTPNGPDAYFWARIQANGSLIFLLQSTLLEHDPQYVSFIWGNNSTSQGSINLRYSALALELPKPYYPPTETSSRSVASFQSENTSNYARHPSYPLFFFLSNSLRKPTPLVACHHSNQALIIGFYVFISIGFQLNMPALPQLVH